MTKYEDLMNKSALNEHKADEQSDMLVKAFYRHAAEGYRRKANKLTVEEAKQPVTTNKAI